MVETLRKSDRFGTAIPHALIILFMGGLASGQDLEMQLESAIHREIVVGDLRGALEQYKSILAEPSASGSTRISMARALFQMAECLEKLGQRAEAQNAYARILNEYGDQAEVVDRARRWLGREDSFSGPRNLKFDQGIPGKAPPGWYVTAPPKDADQWAELRRSGCRSGHSCAVVVSPGNAPIRVGGLQQTFGAFAYRGKTLRVTAWIRVEGVDPEDRAQMWLSVDQTESLMQPAVQSGEWTRCEIVTRVGDTAGFVRFGFISYGKGRTWVDDITVETVTAPDKR